MKKILIASTALVAAGFITAGSASASEKISLNLGGYSKWWVVGQFNNSGAQEFATRNPANVDVKGDNEVYFGGKTKLDNGIEIGIDMQLEAGGHTDSNGTDTIDESYIYVGGGFGKFIIGSKNNGTYLLHVTAPDAAGNWNEGGIMTGGFSVFAPSTVSGLGGGNTTAILTDGDSEKITYVAPTFYGLTVGGSYVPSALSEDNRGSTGNAFASTVVRTDVPAYGVGALYAETFGGVGVKASAGWVTYDAGGASGQNNEYAYGLNLSYAGFTLGGSYRLSNFNATVDATPTNATVTGIGTQSINLYSQKGHGYDAGISYASGPYAVSFAYFHSEVRGSDSTTNGGTATVSGEDKISFYQVSGKYNLGAGVDLLASIGYADYKNGDQTDATGTGNDTDNKGWVAMTGLSLQF
jgi:outer membrane protein OmpU